MQKVKKLSRSRYQIKKETLHVKRCCCRRIERWQWKECWTQQALRLQHDHWYTEESLLAPADDVRCTDSRMEQRLLCDDVHWVNLIMWRSSNDIHLLATSNWTVDSNPRLYTSFLICLSYWSHPFVICKLCSLPRLVNPSLHAKTVEIDSEVLTNCCSFHICSAAIHATLRNANLFLFLQLLVV
jgi:hypothetical protein